MHPAVPALPAYRASVILTPQLPESLAVTLSSTLIRFCRLLSIVLLPLLGSAVTAAPLSAALQSRLDQALLLYSSGKLTAARQAFEGLDRQGVPAAAYNLGVMHLRGELPNADPKKALRLLQRAADEGFVTAQLALGQLYETGQLGARDLVTAHRWYEMAAQNGSVDGQMAAGTAYYLGRGAPRSAVDALRWYREAAKAGDVGAQYLLASMYEHGDGVAMDLRLARYWYDMAARNGDEAAPYKVKELDARAAAGR